MLVWFDWRVAARLDTLHWPARTALYVAVGASPDAISRYASGRAVPTSRGALKLIDAITRHQGGDLRGGVAHLRSPIRVAIDALDARSIWSATCPILPTDADLLIDRIYLACDVPTSRRGEFARLAGEDAFPARHKAYWTSFRSAGRKPLGHLLRVSYCPKFSTKKISPKKPHRPPAYAVISFVPPYLFDPRWRGRVGSSIARRARTRLTALLALATNVRVARIEIAVDVAAPTWALQAIFTTSRRFIVYPRDDHARTIESGSRSSPISLSCYDKANQLLDRWGLDVGHELTRIEVRVKLDEPMPLADLASLSNPFEEITVHLLEPERNAPAGFKIAVRTARLVALPHLHRAHCWVTLKNGRRKSKLLRQVLDRARYVELLDATELDPRSWRAHPRRVFARRWRRVSRELRRDLGSL